MDSLQFQKLEVADTRPKCSACKSVIESSYYHLAGKPICPTCAEIAKSAQQRPGTSGVMRGFLYGLGAAVACSIGYAVVTMTTKMEFALLAILVGYIVGRAVRVGSSGLGGRRCQILAVALTYFSITSSYVPLVIQGLRERAKTEAAKQSDPAPAVQTRRPPSAATLVIGVVAIVGIALVSPFLGLAGGVGGLISIAIIFFGLAQAWKQTKRDERLLMGPYTLEQGQAVG